MQIEQDGEVALAVNYRTICTEIRGKNDNAVGCHKVRVHIEHLPNQFHYKNVHINVNLLMDGAVAMIFIQMDHVNSIKQIRLSR